MYLSLKHEYHMEIFHISLLYTIHLKPLAFSRKDSGRCFITQLEQHGLTGPDHIDHSKRGIDVLPGRPELLKERAMGGKDLLGNCRCMHGS